MYINAAYCYQQCPPPNGGRWALVRLDGVAPSRLVGVSASVNLPLHHKVQKFSSGTGSPGWSRKKGRKMVVVVCYQPSSVVCHNSKPCKTAEAIKMPFRLRTRVGPGNHVLDGGPHAP